MNITIDNFKHFHFTKPQRIDTAMNSLDGFLKGIAIDKQINLKEVASLNNWCEQNKDVLIRGVNNQ